MRTTLFMTVAAALLAAVAGVKVSAHHSFGAEFDANRPVKLEGTVVMMEWINPHSWIHIDVKDPATGKLERWLVEGGAPNALLRRGWNKKSLMEGTAIIVPVRPTRDRNAERRPARRCRKMPLPVAPIRAAWFNAG